MKRRLRVLLASLLSVGILLNGSSAVFAGPLFDDVCNGNGSATVCQEQSKSQTKSNNSIYGSNGVLMKAVNIMALVVGIAAVMAIAISGIRFIASSGDPNSITTARKTIIYSVIGLVVMLVSRSIITFVISRL